MPQSVNVFLILSRLILKGATVGATQDKIIINKNGVIMILDARKVQNKSMMFYLKARRYVSEGQEALTNMPYQKKETSNEKYEWSKKLGLSS